MSAPTPTHAGKTVVVIGGASGVGFAVAEAALADGAKVIVASSQAANVEAAVARLGEGAAGAVVDVADEAAVAAFFAALGPYDHLVFTAGDWGGGMGGPTQAMDLAAAQAGFAVRYWGAFAAAKHGSATLREGGSITLTGGLLAHRPIKGMPLATMVAGAVEFLTRALAVDLAPIRVNAVCLGIVLTERTKQLPEARLRMFTERLPTPRGGEPAEAAQAYLYAMRAGYTTGQILLVDGGAINV
jgi:NAD(P)-dependent dehydrogenase (short-subunit alcohol dehydrogenase family)